MNEQPRFDAFPSWFNSFSTPLSPNNINAENNVEENSQPLYSKIYHELRQGLKPWPEFFRMQKFTWPSNPPGFCSRIKYNLQYFFTNYMCLFLVLFIYCILTSFLMLLAFIVLLGLFYSIYQQSKKGPIVIGGHEVPSNLLYTLAIMLCFPLFALADVGTITFYVLTTSLVLILIHSLFYSSEETSNTEFEVVTVVNA